MGKEEIIEVNKKYWNEHADLWYGTTALPKHGVRFPTEDDLHLFKQINGKKMLEICRGSGRSMLYHAQGGAGELWWIDLSEKQLKNASAYTTFTEVPGGCISNGNISRTAPASGIRGNPVNMKRKSPTMTISFCSSRNN